VTVSLSVRILLHGISVVNIMSGTNGNVEKSVV